MKHRLGLVVLVTVALALIVFAGTVFAASPFDVIVDQTDNGNGSGNWSVEVQNSINYALSHIELIPCREFPVSTAFTVTVKVDGVDLVEGIDYEIGFGSSIKVKFLSDIAQSGTFTKVLVDFTEGFLLLEKVIVKAGPEEDFILTGRGCSPTAIRLVDTQAKPSVNLEDLGLVLLTAIGFGTIVTFILWYGDKKKERERED